MRGKTLQFISRSDSAGKNLAQRVQALWRRVLKLTGPQPRCLRLCDTLSLGERRIVAVVDCGGARFLLGGTSASVVLLARLDREPGPNPVAAGNSLDKAFSPETEN